MVTLMDIWVWLGVNSDSFTALLGIGAIVLAFYVAKRSPRWQYEAEYKKTLIQEIFPELTSNIRSTIDLYHRFLEEGMFRYAIFPNLFELINTGKIKQINKIDKTLYDNLIKIREELFPIMDEMQQDRQNLKKVLRDRWEIHLKSLENINFDIARFTSDLYDANSYHLWIENYDIFLTQSTDIFYKMRHESHLDREIIPPTDDQILELRRIAEVEIARIKEKVEPIEVMIKEIITDVVIPRLEEIIADPF